MANEKRLIDANEILRFLENEIDKHESSLNKWERDYVKAVRVAAKILRCFPTVDAVEVVHGRWLYDSGSGKYFCSACDEYALSFKKDTLYGGDLYEVCLTDYCPNCGADMRGE